MTLGKIQELLLNLREVIDEFNKNCMPDGFFICEEQINPTNQQLLLYSGHSMY